MIHSMFQKNPESITNHQGRPSFFAFRGAFLSRLKNEWHSPGKLTFYFFRLSTPYIFPKKFTKARAGGDRSRLERLIR